MYPGGQGQYSKMSGIGLLRLHSTYRHDLKIYASDEGRVQMTAAAFAKVLRLMLKKNVIKLPMSVKEMVTESHSPKGALRFVLMLIFFDLLCVGLSGS